MTVVWTVLGVIAKTLGILLLVVLALLVLALVIPVSAWLAYDGDNFTVRVGALGLQYPVFPPRETKPKDPKKSKKAKPARKQAGKKPAAQPTKTAQAAQAAQKVTPEPPQGDTAKDGEQAPPQDKKLLLGLSFQQLVTAVKGLGKFGQRVVAGLRITHIRLYLPITGEDAADTAMRYGKCQAWLGAGMGVLNRAVWLDFDEYRLEADFLAKEGKKPHFSCQISARLLIMVIAAARYLWLLWRAKILEALLAQFSGQTTSKEKDNG